eukprot:jgi/Chlat1/49/ChrspC238589S00928
MARATQGREESWFWQDRNGQANGPACLQELRRLWTFSLINDSTLVWINGLRSWVSLGSWPTLRAALLRRKRAQQLEARRLARERSLPPVEPSAPSYTVEDGNTPWVGINGPTRYAMKVSRQLGG